jgi:hypothetical protein
LYGVIRTIIKSFLYIYTHQYLYTCIVFVCEHGYALLSAVLYPIKNYYYWEVFLKIRKSFQKITHIKSESVSEWSEMFIRGRLFQLDSKSKRWGAHVVVNPTTKRSRPRRHCEIYLNIAIYNNGFISLNIRPTRWLVFLILQNIVTSVLIIIIPKTKPEIFNCNCIYRKTRFILPLPRSYNIRPICFIEN